MCVPSLSDTLRVALEDWLQFVHASSQAIPANRLAQYRRQDADRKWTETLRVRMETRLSLWKQRLAVWQDDAACELLEAVAVANNLATTAVWVPAGIADHKQSMPIDELEQRLDVLMKQLDKRMQDDLDGEYAYIERTWLTHTSLQEVRFFADAQARRGGAGGEGLRPFYPTPPRVDACVSHDVCRECFGNIWRNGATFVRAASAARTRYANRPHLR